MNPLINRSAICRVMEPDNWLNMAKYAMRRKAYSFNMRHVRNFRNDPDVMELLQLLETVVLDKSDHYEWDVLPEIGDELVVADSRSLLGVGEVVIFNGLDEDEPELVFSVKTKDDHHWVGVMKEYLRPKP